MSTPITEPVTAVVPETKGAPEGVVTEVNEHTPDPATPPVVDKAPDPPRPDHEGIAQLQMTVTGLATAVATLTETVTGLVTGSRHDASPAKRPWTHIGSPVKDE